MRRWPYILLIVASVLGCGAPRTADVTAKPTAESPPAESLLVKLKQIQEQKTANRDESDVEEEKGPKRRSRRSPATSSRRDTTTDR